ncbi:ethanolamine ammonia-lyase subunit EutC [Mucilaginibacter polytrichastri]|uniref:Ethanolamine ammonia-lyase small subunit n=1 Tax=Mucilaginibacter polytrichastri TaxID=1302689 RepID=A0A1Q6A573_9SPHI|nr:ethanolamine ammonia-lyase subunit EutC [Mucilaginibacter polytrichastri]OKS89159.1 Ethanolamine ammonia-lyase light chain [Mucilaginibacter polytrichastri]SFS97267.1 Ethanolamine ammonia-lyase light chain [Mucilaginibacter polytrichastri]
MKKPAVKTTDPWESLKEFTAARIAMGRVGSSIPLTEYLKFKLAHAHARDAVYSELNSEALMYYLKHLDIPILKLHSKAENRHQYLQRPDLGRLPSDQSTDTIKEHTGKYDISIIIADGLSAHAVNSNAVQLVEGLVQLFRSVKYKLAPICLTSQSRVALADHIAHGLNARLSIMLIGERPGLSSADSVGAYLTYNPKPGLTDESRNCVSNIRPEGLTHNLAAEKIFYLVQEAFRRKLSGVNLKDDAGLLNQPNSDLLSP